MFNLIAKIIGSSIVNLFKNQPDILINTSKTTMTEWNFADHLANEIAKYIFWLNHDLEVVKRNHSNHRPDIIFHKRGINELNFLVVEIKIGNDVRGDILKIKKDWMCRELKYRFGASIRIESNKSWEFTCLNRDVNKELVVKTPISQIIPIPKISDTENINFISLVDKILDFVKNENCLNELANKTKEKELESQIDEMVYKLYG